MAINHGTRSGYYAHRRVQEPPCDECRAAINEYVRQYRKDNGLARNRQSDRIRRQALNALRDAHPAEYQRIVEQLRADDDS